MEILIVRHGDPDYANDTLTEKGKIEAELLAEKLSKMKIDACYVSPLGRARDTAQYTLDKINQEAEVLDWLHEFRGRQVLEDGTKRRCWEQLPSVWANEEIYYTDDWYKTDLMKSVNAGEEYHKIIAEFNAFLESYGYKREGKLFKVLKGNHDRVVLFCHYAVGCVLTSYLLGIPPVPLWNNAVALTSSVTTFVTEEREQGIATFRMMAYGDIGHLYAGGEPASFAARYCECFEDDTRH